MWQTNRDFSQKGTSSTQNLGGAWGFRLETIVNRVYSTMEILYSYCTGIPFKNGEKKKNRKCEPLYDNK